MGAKKFLLKTLVAGAVIGGVAAMLKKMKENGQMDELETTADRIKNKVVKQAKKLGKLTKSAYENIVDTTVAEYRGVKALSENDLEDLGDELKASWEDIQEVLMSAKEDVANDIKKAVKKKRA